jgi:glycerophosphoryl diester phosphodiesterase
MHDETLERTTLNSTGYTCERTAAELQRAVVLPVDAGKSGVPCERAGNYTGTGRAGCVFRIPTLDQVFAELAVDVQIMIDAKVCFIVGAESTSTPAVPCNTCHGQISRLYDLLELHRIDESRLVLTSTDVHTLTMYSKAFPKSSTALSVDHHYAHYSVSQFERMLHKGGWDGVAMYYNTAALRPDLVAATQRSQRLVYAWTVRKDWQAFVAICSGADALIVADPHRYAPLLEGRPL